MNKRRQITWFTQTHHSWKIFTTSPINCSLIFRHVIRTYEIGFRFRCIFRYKFNRIRIDRYIISCYHKTIINSLMNGICCIIGRKISISDSTGSSRSTTIDPPSGLKTLLPLIGERACQTAAGIPPCQGFFLTG